jgi:hypothetical protein
MVVGTKPLVHLKDVAKTQPASKKAHDHKVDLPAYFKMRDADRGNLRYAIELLKHFQL